ncbi:MAG: hypothetical protein Q9169_000723 [Polycauliona sp. 2 TL-2023]
MGFTTVVPASWSSLVWLILGALAAHVAARVFYRLYFSPLASFPGPKLTASTYWVEFYYDLIKGGRFQRQIARMHEQYGPIVRINPDELHIQDTEFYDQFYQRENKLDKFPGQTKMFGGDMFFTTITHELHHLRQSPYAPFFSKKSIANMSDFITDRVDTLCRRIRESGKHGLPMPLGIGFVALTTDIISSYALADCYHLLERDDLGSEYHHLMLGFIQGCHFIKHLTPVFNVMQALPDRMVLWLRPSLRLAMQMMKKMQSDVQSIIDDLSSGNQEPKPGMYLNVIQSNLSSQDKSNETIAREGMSLIIAGSETTASTLSIITYHLLANPDKLVKLRGALEQAIPNSNTPPSLGRLEAIPYLYACIQEGLRLAYGTSNRLTRVSRVPIKYRDWMIPAGVAVGMTTIFSHDDESIFPAHKVFQPERWLEKREDGVRLEKYLTSFGRGTRQCLGINLAYAELYMTIATIFRRFELELFETDRSTVEYGRDYFNPFPENGCDGVKVLVK